MNWAMDQKTDGPSAQSVLFVVADRANEHGVCRHADPDTIALKTRQSRATVFRRLDELERVGLLTRFTKHLDDGRREYEVRLAFERLVNYRVDKERNVRIYDYADDECIDVIEMLAVDGSQIETQDGSQIETEPVALVRPGESQSCDPQEDSDLPSKNPKIPPNPPSGGERVVDQDLEQNVEEFRQNWLAPITNLPRLRSVLGAMVPSERQRVLTAARGYASFISECERKGKPRAVKDAHTWVGGGLWEGYVVAGERSEIMARMQLVDVESDAGKALMALHQIARVSPIESGGKLLLKEPLSDQAMALARAPPIDEWILVPAAERNRCGAWDQLLREALPGVNRPALVHDRNPGGASGFMAPYSWPPRKDGTLCDTAA
jgi:hypothetical protein